MLCEWKRDAQLHIHPPTHTLSHTHISPRFTNYMTSSTSVGINLVRREMVILGTEYAGEMKKGIFSVRLGYCRRRKMCKENFVWVANVCPSVPQDPAHFLCISVFTPSTQVMHYWMPKRGVLSLHSGCNVGKQGDVTLFFGLSGV